MISAKRAKLNVSQNPMDLDKTRDAINTIILKASKAGETEAFINGRIHDDILEELRVAGHKITRKEQVIHTESGWALATVDIINWK